MIIGILAGNDQLINYCREQQCGSIGGFVTLTGCLQSNCSINRHWTAFRTGSKGLRVRHLPLSPPPWFFFSELWYSLAQTASTFSLNRKDHQQWKHEKWYTHSHLIRRGNQYIPGEHDSQLRLGHKHEGKFRRSYRRNHQSQIYLDENLTECHS